MKPISHTHLDHDCLWMFDGNSSRRVLLPTRIKKTTPLPQLTQPEAERLFALKIGPLLNSKCLGCHGEKEDDIKGELDVRIAEWSAERW